MLKEERPVPGRSVLLNVPKPVQFSEVTMNEQKSEQNGSISARHQAPLKVPRSKLPAER